MNFICESKMQFNANSTSKAVADNGRKSVKFSIHDVRSRILELCQCMGIINALSK